MSTATFFTYIDGKDVSITLAEGEAKEYHWGGETDEGYDYASERFTLENGVVTIDGCRKARDCDGPLESYGTCHCPVTQLQAGHVSEETGRAFPNWTQGEYTQIDHYAESMSY